jgi:hypothetical protein
MMYSVYLWLSRLFWLSAFGMAGLAASQALFPHRSMEPSLRLDVSWPNPDLGVISPGHHGLVVNIANPTGRTCRIIGMADGCGPRVCFQPAAAQPVVIAAGAVCRYTIEFTIGCSGPFEIPVALFLDDEGMREARLTLHGVAAAPEGQTNGETR